MAASDANVFPPKNAAFRLYLGLYDPTGTLSPGWLSATASVSKDGGAYAASTNTLTEVGSSGTGYLDLTASEMNAECVMVKASGAATLERVIVIYTGGVSEIGGSSAAPTAAENAAAVWNYADPGDAAGRATTTGGLLAQLWRYCFNRNRQQGSALTVYRDDSSSALLSSTFAASDTAVDKGKAS